MAKCSGELEVGCPIYAEALVVLTFVQSEVDLLPSDE
jgi:hypothetical protein